MNAKVKKIEIEKTKKKIRVLKNKVKEVDIILVERLISENNESAIISKLLLLILGNISKVKAKKYIDKTDISQLKDILTKEVNSLNFKKNKEDLVITYANIFINRKWIKDFNYDKGDSLEFSFTF